MANFATDIRESTYSSPKKRLSSLDGLRGIAALFVLLSHFADTNPAFSALHTPSTIWYFVENPLAILKYTPLRILVAGRAMVLVFFVLSGFVLCYSYRPGAGYASYLAKRLFRIYPPFVAAILVSSALYLLIDPKPVATASYWFNDLNWSTPPSPAFIASNLAMTGIPQWPTINNPTWSLIHEMRISIIFPLLVLALRWRFVASIAISIVVGLASLYSESGNPVILTVQLTIGYVTFFRFWSSARDQGA